MTSAALKWFNLRRQASRCPSGCRLQGHMWQVKSEADRKLRAVCKTAKMVETSAEKSLMALAHVYSSNRRAIVSSHGKAGCDWLTPSVNHPDVTLFVSSVGAQVPGTR